MIDELVKNRKSTRDFMPAEAEIKEYHVVTNELDPGACPGPDPGFAGVTSFYDVVLFGSHHSP